MKTAIGGGKRAGAGAALPLWLALAALGLAACTGDTGPEGPAGEPGVVGPPGPPPGGGVWIGDAQFIRSSIVSAAVPEDGRPVIEVRLVNEHEQPLAGLPAGNISFVLARLEPAYNDRTSTWHAVTRRTEAFPGSPAPTPASKVTGTGPTNQGYTEAGTAGKWVEDSRRNGVYTYTFAQSLKGIADIPYDPNLVHRVGLEIRTRPNLTPAANIPANNAVYTWRPATGSPIEPSGREIVDNDTCNACHDNLEFHGGARFDLQYCAMCHESYSSDAQSGQSLDLKVMIHKIHRGEELPSAQPPGFYGIFGFGNAFVDFSHVAYPRLQDPRNCTTCHQESDTDTPEAANWRKTVSATVCASCHDDVNFRSGANHAGVAATDDQCSACHGPDSNLTANGASLRTEARHYDPLLRASGKFAYEVLNVANTAPGQKPTVTIRVTDPTNNNAPYDIKAPGGPFQVGSSSLAVDVAFSTRPDFTNTGSGSAPTPTTGTPAQPIRIDFKATAVPDPAYPGGFKATATVAIPANAQGSGSALIEGRPVMDVDGNGTLDTVPVKSAGKAFGITDKVPVPYRRIVDIGKCDDCHKTLALHGNTRAGNAELCATCHNPNATDIARRVAGSNCQTVTGTLDDQTIDFKVMVHAIHAGPVGAFKVCGYNNTGYDFSHVAYPGRLNNCEGCHDGATYYPPAAGAAFATTIDAGPDRSTPLGDVAITPAAAVCSSCHKAGSARVHMELNGSSFSAVKAADSSTPGVPLENCAICHGPGRTVDVKTVHGVGAFQYNQ